MGQPAEMVMRVRLARVNIGVSAATVGLMFSASSFGRRVVDGTQIGRSSERAETTSRCQYCFLSRMRSREFGKVQLLQCW